MGLCIPDTSIRTGKLLPHILRVGLIVIDDDAADFGGVRGFCPGRNGDGLASQGDDGGDFAEAKTLADDFAGYGAGGAGDDELHFSIVFWSEVLIKWMNCEEVRREREGVGSNHHLYSL